VRTHQKVLLNALCKAAAYSLMKLALDPHYIGGKIGILSVVHTWTRAMIYHPHVHCLVPGGGLDGSRWIPARKGFLVPVTALSKIFRARFMELAGEALPEVVFPDSVWEKDWVVYSKASVQGTEKVLNYLARYMHRVAITNSRILSIDDGRIRFRYKDSRENAWKVMTLPAEEFIRRFLQHVLPRGFHKVRYYGILSHSNRHLLARAKALLSEAQTDLPCKQEPMSPPPSQPLLCPSCKRGHLFCIGRVPPKERSPP
ncbi:MAG: IS91 family transposase, partial [Synergistales bacterium]|nr:IS91 family transposase [Synergistales bacterium]